MIETVERLNLHPRYASVGYGWNPMKSKLHRSSHFLEASPPPVFKEALDFTDFGLKEFKKRANRDDASLVILATHTLSSDFLGGGENIRWFNLLKGMAKMNEIPIIDQYDHILRRDGKIADAHWPHDGHWNSLGHQWAAEALLEYLQRHPEICDRPGAKEMS